MGHVGKGLIAGFLATLVLSALMLMKSWIGLMQQLDVIGMLSGMLGASVAIGCIVHFVVGTVFYGVAFALLERSLPGGPTVSSMVLGAIGWWWPSCPWRARACSASISASWRRS